MGTDARVLDASKFVRSVLPFRSIAFYLLVIVVSMVTTALPAQASGTVQTTFSWADAWGFTSGDPMAFCSGYLRDAAAVNGAVYTLKSYPVDPNTHILSCYADIAPPTNLLNAYAGSFPPVFGCPVNSLNTSYYGMTCTCNTNFHPDTPAASCVPDCPVLASGTCGQNACPANMARQSPAGACACKPGFVPAPNGGAGCVPRVLKITLAADSTTEPWNKKHDKYHQQANVSLSVLVWDNNSALVPNIPVTITADVTFRSGGHPHGNGNRPKGWLAQTPADFSTQIENGATHGQTTLTGTTDSHGFFFLTFGAEEVSGVHTVTATCQGCQPAGNTATVTVKVDGLKPLDTFLPLPVMILDYPKGGEIGAARHVHNHYFTPEAIKKLRDLSVTYFTQVNFANQLYLNDSSLEWGGLFDVGGTEWSTPHAGHRKGVVVDIRAERRGAGPIANKGAIPEALFGDFSKAASDIGINAQLHCFDQNGLLKIGSVCIQIQTGLHFHTQLLGVDQ